MLKQDTPFSPLNEFKYFITRKINAIIEIPTPEDIIMGPQWHALEEYNIIYEKSFTKGMNIKL